MIEKLYDLYIRYQTICTDTRNIIPGSIFFALKGDNFNANNFANEALEKGCVYAVIDEPQPYKTKDVSLLTMYWNYYNC